MDSLGPRGPLTEFLFDGLTGRPHDLGHGPSDEGDVLSDDDFQLALYTCYELHYQGFEDVDERWEWEPSLVAFRGRLEKRLEVELRAEVETQSVEPENVPRALQDLAARDSEPSLSRYLERDAGVDQYKEFLVHRSIYHLREADSHTWALPRLTGRPKAALVEIQMDEYGSGLEERMHSSLFARALEAMDLRSDYRAYIDRVPGVTLATVNLMSFLGLHRRLRGACMGHLALFEMTSSEPNRRYARGLTRLGYGSDATAFFDEHVEADSIHEVIAANDLAGTLASESHELADDILFGAHALDLVDKRFAGYVLERWEKGQSSLRAEQPSVALS